MPGGLTALHPERIARMILYGGYARGAFKRGDARTERAYRAMVELARASWNASNPTFRQVFTSRFIPGGTPQQLQWFNELCAKCTVGEIAAELLEARAEIDICELLPQVRTPTLILHSREDEVVPIAEGRRLAAEIKGAEFVELDSRNHVLLEHEPAWQRFQEEVLPFAQGEAMPGVFSALSHRERAVLALIARGLSNAWIAEQLQIGDKRCGIMPPTCSTNSACARGPRRSCPLASTGSAVSEPPGGAKLLVNLGPTHHIQEPRQCTSPSGSPAGT